VDAVDFIEEELAENVIQLLALTIEIPSKKQQLPQRPLILETFSNLLFFAQRTLSQSNTVHHCFTCSMVYSSLSVT